MSRRGVGFTESLIQMRGRSGAAGMTAEGPGRQRAKAGARSEEFAVWRRAEAGDDGDDCGGVKDDGAMALCRLDAMGSGRGRRTIDGVVQGEGRAATVVDGGDEACSAIGGVAALVRPRKIERRGRGKDRTKGKRGEGVHAGLWGW
ncbi:hypothetical protein U1Q18_001862 [Sarracenia purpurea var. burkii]